MKYFSFDVETDGLYGQAFAIAAAVVDENGQILDRFCEKCIAPGITDAWTKENCLPYLSEIPDCESRAALRQHFWAFYSRYREECVIVADVTYPVEAGLLRACVEDNLEERKFQGPYPLIDVASVLFAHGINPDVNRMDFSDWHGKRHHPLDDAVASVLCLIKAMKRDQRGS